MAWSNLKFKKLRSFLTITGVIIGIGSIFFLLSLGLGLQNMITNDIIGNRSVKTLDISSPNSTIIRVDQTNFEKIKNLPHVVQTGGSFTGSGTIKLNSSEVDTVIYGVTDDYQSLAGLTILKGKFFSKSDINKLVINTAGLEVLGIKNADQAIGKDLELKANFETNDSTKEVSRKYTIAGVIDSGNGSEVFVPRTIFDVNGVKNYTQLKVVTDNVNNVPDLRDKIESLGLTTASPLDTIQQIRQLFKYVNLTLIGFGSIGMIVAILGMFNTLTISLLERTREIGLMIALGVHNHDIRQLFIYESVLLSLIGSVMGIVLARLGGLLINLVLQSVTSSRGFSNSFSIFSTPWWLPVLSILFMVVVGLGVAYFPARRAEKISPVDALRGD